MIIDFQQIKDSGVVPINEVINGDCLEVMPYIPDKSIDMILCDLPYGTTACKWDVVIDFDLLWLQYKRVIKDNGAIVLTATNPFASILINSNLKMFKYEWVWFKNNTSGFALVKKQPMRNHELILVFYKKQSIYNYIKEPRDVTKASYLRNQYASTSLKGKNNLQNGINKVRNPIEDLDLCYPKTIKRFKGVHSSKRLHPTQKPVELFEYLIKTYTNECETVLDNCAGSFTTSVASNNLNRNWICIEKEKEYCEIGLKRILENRESPVLPII